MTPSCPTPRRSLQAGGVYPPLTSPPQPVPRASLTVHDDNTVSRYINMCLCRVKCCNLAVSAILVMPPLRKKEEEVFSHWRPTHCKSVPPAPRLLVCMLLLVSLHLMPPSPCNLMKKHPHSCPPISIRGLQLLSCFGCSLCESEHAGTGATCSCQMLMRPLIG